MAWPTYYPKDCPPDEATDAGGTFYRLVKNDPPAQEDFLSNRQLHPGRHYDDAETECRSCGLSLFADLADALAVRRQVPALRKRLVAVGTLASAQGRLRHTPSTRNPSHHT